MAAFKNGSLFWEGIVVSESTHLERSWQSNEERGTQLRGVSEERMVIKTLGNHMEKLVKL